MAKAQQVIAAPQTEADALAAQVQALIGRVESGDESAVPELRAALSRVESSAGMEALRLPSPATWSERAVRRMLAKENKITRETLLRHFELAVAELAGPNPSRLEELLCRRVVLAQVISAAADASLEGARASGQQAFDLWVKTAARCERRLAAAVLALQRWRKMALPELRRLRVIDARDCPEGGGR